MSMKRLTATIAAAAACACALQLPACAPEETQRSAYFIRAEYDGESSLTGRVELDYFNDTGNALDCLKFNLWGNAFRRDAAASPVPSAARDKAYYAGESYGSMEITSAEGGNWRVCGEDENILEITFDQPVYPDERASCAIDFTLDLAKVNARTGVTEHGTVNLGNFYPVLCAYTRAGFAEYAYASVGDPFVSHAADYTVELAAPNGYAVAASGMPSFEKTENGVTTRRYELGAARDFAAVLSESFRTIGCSAAGAEVTYCYYDDEDAETVLAAAAESLQYFSDAFGQYPYPSFTVVQTPLTADGAEYPALAMISAGCSGEDAVRAAVHETAHQWWYAAVGNDGYAHAWQDEGLAEYSALMFFESHPRYGPTRPGMLGEARGAYRAYFSVYDQLFGGADTSMEREPGSFSGEYEYVNIVRNKGLMLFEALRDACGDEAFTAALKDYFGQYLSGIAPPEGLMAAFCRRADCEGIFDSFLSGKVII